MIKEKQKPVAVKVFPDTRTKLNIIAAKLNENQYQILARLIEPEYQKVEGKKP